MAADLPRCPLRPSWPPIFHPITNEEYAIQIARDRNTRDAENSSLGYISRVFPCPRSTSRAFRSKRVGDREHLESWVPAEELDGFNRQIVGQIEVSHEFRPGPVI